MVVIFCASLTLNNLTTQVKKNNKKKTFVAVKFNYQQIFSYLL